MLNPSRPVLMQCAVAACTALLLGAAAEASVSYRTVAVAGEPAPDFPGQVYRTIGGSKPAINNAGTVLFYGSVAPALGEDATGAALWANTAGSTVELVRLGEQAVGFPLGAEHASFVSWHAGSDDVYGFSGAVYTGGKFKLGIWGSDGGARTLVAGRDEVAPGTGGSTFATVYQPVVNASGHMAFSANLDTTTYSFQTNSVWTWDGGSTPTMLARAGDAAPGLTGAGFDHFEGSIQIAFNDAGHIAFRGQASTTDPVPTVSRGVWAGTAGDLRLVAASGESAAGIGGDAVFDGFGWATLSDSGRVGMLGVITGTGIDEINHVGLWRETAGGLEVVARLGDAAPEAGAGVVFSEIVTYGYYAGEQMVLTAGVSGPDVDDTNALGIWRERNGSMDLLVRTGDQAAGTAEGTVFVDVAFPEAAFNWATNRLGQVAFEGHDSGGESGIWVIDENGDMHLVIRTGTLFDVNDDPLVDDLRLISDFGFQVATGVGHGMPRSFNDAGELVFGLTFADGTSGVFTATIPEPASAFALCVLGAALIRRRR